MMAIQGHGSVSIWTLIFLTEVRCTLPEDFWKMFAPSTSSLTKPTTASVPKDDNSLFQDISFDFEGGSIHPTESYPYPTPPPGDKGFEKWEQEEEKKYADAVLAQLSSPNDTEPQAISKSFLATYLVNTALDASAAWHRLNNSTSEGPYYIHPDEIQSIPTNQPKTQSIDEIQPTIPIQGSSGDNEIEPTLFPTISTQNPSEDEEIQPTLLPTNPPQDPSRDIYIQPGTGEEQMQQQIIEQEQFINTEQQQYTTTNSIQSIINPSPQQNLSGDGGSLPPVIDVVNMFEPIPISQPRTTPYPDVSPEEYYIVNPVVETMISKQQANLEKQVERLIESVNNGNISGVVDTTLKIASLETVGVFVNGFLNMLRCNPVDRWNGRCN